MVSEDLAGTLKTTTSKRKGRGRKKNKNPDIMTSRLSVTGNNDSCSTYSNKPQDISLSNSNDVLSCSLPVEDSDVIVDSIFNDQLEHISSVTTIPDKQTSVPLTQLKRSARIQDR